MRPGLSKRGRLLEYGQLPRVEMAGFGWERHPGSSDLMAFPSNDMICCRPVASIPDPFLEYIQWTQGIFGLPTLQEAPV